MIARSSFPIPGSLQERFTIQDVFSSWLKLIDNQ
jgi:hypothetical protein